MVGTVNAVEARVVLTGRKALVVQSASPVSGVRALRPDPEAAINDLRPLSGRSRWHVDCNTVAKPEGSRAPVNGEAIMNKLTPCLFASVVCWSMVSAAHAGQLAGEPQPPIDPTPTSDSRPTFEQLDTNRDGSVAKSEVPIDHALTTLFANYDHDNDEFLTRIEFDEYAMEDEEEGE